MMILVEDARQSWSIRRATIEDASGILRCLLAAFEAYRDRYTPAAFADTVLTPDTVSQRVETMCMFVAINSSGEVIGTIGCHVINSEEGHIRGMAVHPTWHGSGIARHLMNSAESELRQRKCSRVTLDTTEPLVPAMLFYERNGFRRLGKVTNFFGMPLFEYVKTLTP